MDYTQITVRDICYFLNGRADKSHNEELFVNCYPEDFPDSEMYLFIQQKSNNFNHDLLEYLIFDIRTHPVQYAMKINDDFIDLYDVDLSKSNLKLSSKPGEKLHEAIERDMNDNKELILYSDQIIVFSKIAEELYLKHSKKNTHQKKNSSDKFCSELPAELKTDKAKEIFSRAIAAGFIAETEISYVWKGQKNELAYFAELMSKYLNLSHGDKNNSFKPFEITFGINGLCRVANDYKKIGKVPARHKMLDALFEM